MRDRGDGKQRMREAHDFEDEEKKKEVSIGIMVTWKSKELQLGTIEINLKR